MHANKHNARGLNGPQLEGEQGLPLHLIQTHVDRVPRESLWETCSDVDNGVRGLSACSVIRTTFYLFYTTPPIGSSCRPRATYNQTEKLQEALARKVWEDRSMQRAARQRRSRERGGSSGEQHQEQQGRGLPLLEPTASECWEELGTHTLSHFDKTEEIGKDNFNATKGKKESVREVELCAKPLRDQLHTGKTPASFVQAAQRSSAVSQLPASERFSSVYARGKSSRGRQSPADAMNLQVTVQTPGGSLQILQQQTATPRVNLTQSTHASSALESN